MRVCGIDIGICNLSYAVVAFEPQPVTQSTPDITRAEHILAQGENICAWSVETLPLCEGQCAVERVARGCVAFVEQKAELLASCDVVVLEQQMCERMRIVAAALCAALVGIHPTVRTTFQSSRCKLQWKGTDLDTSTYYRRKRSAVTLCSRVLGQGPRAAEFAAHKKKDDLADSLLHSLYWICAHGS